MSASPDDPSANITLTPGQIFEDRFEIISILGKGGVGVVYKARHLRMEKIVAIKTLRSIVVSDDEESFRRFELEAKTASSLNHANIISIFDFGKTSAGLVYLVMEYLGDRTLEGVLIAEKYLEFERFASIASQICDGLHHAHKKGIVHRDLKPSNIMLVSSDDDGASDAESETKHDNVKIVDFGLAKLTAIESSQHLTKTGTIVGTPLYMSPEQCRGLELDIRSDIYSLGCMFYATLTGHLPIHGATALDTLYQHTAVMPRSFADICPGLEFPPRLEKVIFKALAKDPYERQQSALELREEIVKAVADPGFRRSIADSVNRKIAFQRSSSPLEKASADDSGCFQSIDGRQTRLQNDLGQSNVQDQSETVRTPPDGMPTHVPKFDSSSISLVVGPDELKKGGALLGLEKEAGEKVDGKKLADVDYHHSPTRLTDPPKPVVIDPKPVSLPAPRPLPWQSVLVGLLVVGGGVAYFAGGHGKIFDGDKAPSKKVVQANTNSLPAESPFLRRFLANSKSVNPAVSTNPSSNEIALDRIDWHGTSLGSKNPFVVRPATDSRTLAEKVANLTGKSPTSSPAIKSQTPAGQTGFSTLFSRSTEQLQRFEGLSLAEAAANQQYRAGNWAAAATAFERVLKLQQEIYPFEQHRRFTPLVHLIDCRSRLDQQDMVVSNLVSALYIYKNNSALVTTSVNNNASASATWEILARACQAQAKLHNDQNYYRWSRIFDDLAKSN
ncbi:MAG: serine/threonine protein kinase [Cyanobacteria bacterium REEB67]|nr:serine/threonine protein kinase [Cyanobacteria bacterium REEB67]